MIRNIIFDYGDVLIKTDCRKVYTAVFGSWDKASWFRNNILEPEWISRLDIGEDYAACIADLQRKYPEYAEAIAMYDTRFNDFLVGTMPGMEHLLSRLKADGYQLYGLSNFSHKVFAFERKLPIFRLLEGQIVSSDVHVIKPDARIFKLLLAKYGLRADECLFIDDREVNVNAARALGISALTFPKIEFTHQQILNGISREYSLNTTPPALSTFKEQLTAILT